MRIHIFSASLRFTGGRLALFRHANELLCRGHAVTIYTQEKQSVVDWLEVRPPIRPFNLSQLSTLPCADVCLFDRIRLAAPLLQAGLGQILHFCQGFEGTDAELRLRQAWEHQGLLGIAEVWRQWHRVYEVNRAYRLPTIKVVTHRHLGELIARRFGQPSYFVPYGLPSGLFTPPKVHHCRVPTVLVVGPTDTAWKRIPDALHAVRLLKQSRPEVRLVRVAQHPIRKLECQIGVTDEYHTMLPPTQMADLYRRADMLLISSDATEGFGLPLLEALASGVPCVATDIPAFRTFASPSDYARFVPVGDSAAMAKAMAELFDNELERARFCKRGLQVAAEYSMQRSFDAMEAVLQAIVDSKPGSRRIASKKIA